jgi:anti-sigma factor RsiW
MNIGAGPRTDAAEEFEDEHALVGAYVLNAVNEQERTEFEEHLAGCPLCSVDVPAFREVLARYAASAASPPPPELVSRAVAEAHRVPQERARGGIFRRILRLRGR